MSVLEILRWPDPRLMEICPQIAEITPEIETLAADMLETMYAAPGRGLAGPQVGAMVRMFVMDTGWKEGKPDPLVCINPMLQEVSEEHPRRERRHLAPRAGADGLDRLERRALCPELYRLCRRLRPARAGPSGRGCDL